MNGKILSILIALGMPLIAGAFKDDDFFKNDDDFPSILDSEKTLLPTENELEEETLKQKAVQEAVIEQVVKPPMTDRELFDSKLKDFYRIRRALQLVKADMERLRREIFKKALTPSVLSKKQNETGGK